MEQLTDLSRGVSEFGFMVVTSATYLLCSATILFFFVRWFVRIVDNIIERQQRILDEILQLQRENNVLLEQCAGNRSKGK